MLKYILLFFILHSAYFISIAQTPQQKLLRSQLKKAEGKLYYPENENQLRNERAVIFYDDFSVPGNWTMTNTSTPSYDWEILDTMPANLISQNFGPNVNSTSGGNFAIVNSELQGSGAMQNCNLTTTNSIDCSSNTKVQLRFENYHRIFYETHTVFVSNDGVNFDPYIVNTTYGAGSGNYVTSPNMEEVIVNITSTASSQPTVWLRFNYNGSWDYFWVIDDITVEDIPSYDITGRYFGYCDLNTSTVFGERIEHTILPSNQIRDLKFIGDIKASGFLNASDSQLKIEVENSTSTIIHTDTTTSINLGINWVTDSIVWSPPAFLQEYQIHFSAQYDSASTIATGYTRTLDFIVDVPYSCDFARDNNTYSNLGIWNGNNNAYVLGNEFMITSNQMVYGIKVALTTATDPGVSVCPILFEMDPGAATINDVFVPIQDNCLDGIDYTVTANDLSSGSNINWLYLYFPSPVTLTSGKSYLAAINHYGGTEQMVIMDGGSTCRGAATVFIYDPTATTGGPWFYMTNKPMIRLFGNDFLCVGGIPENNLFSDFLISPNPTSDFATLHFTLSNNSEVTFSLIDISGKEILQQNLGNKNAGEYSHQINLIEFSPGIYFCKLKAGNQEQTIKLIKTE